MPIQICYESNPSGVVAKGIDTVTGSEFLTANQELIDCNQCTYQIIDMSEASLFQISMEELHQVAIQDRKINKTYALEKMAIVGDDEIVKDVYQTFEFFSLTWVGRYKPFTSRFFNGLQDARAWVSVPN